MWARQFQMEFVAKTPVVLHDQIHQLHADHCIPKTDIRKKIPIKTFQELFGVILLCLLASKQQRETVQCSCMK